MATKQKLKPFELPKKLKEKRAVFLNSPIDPLTMAETIGLIEQAMADKKALQHVVVNVAKLVNMQKDEELRASVAASDLINIDGAGVVMGARLCGHKVPERVAGIDIMDETLKLCAEKGFKPYILGATEVALYKAVENIKIKYPAIEFAGYRNGYFKKEVEEQVMADIAKTKPDCLFVAMPSPHKERIMNSYKNTLNVPFIMGVGGSVDVFAGVTKRAPKWMQKIGCEWLYRLIQEPRRMWRRYLVTNSKFAWLLLKERFKSK